MKNFFCISGGARMSVHLLIASFVVALPSARAILPPAHEALPNFDRRVEAIAITAEQQRSRGRLVTQLSAAKVDFDPMLGTPKFVRAGDGFLSGTNGVGRAVSGAMSRKFNAADPHQPVKAFLDEHATLFGHGAEVLAAAQLQRESVGAHNGLRTVVWQQQLDGIPVFEANLIGNITKNGELVNISSRFLPDPAKNADDGVVNRHTVQSAPPISAADAIAIILANVGEKISAANVAATGAIVGNGYRSFAVKESKTYARLVWLPMDRSKSRLAWEVFTKAGVHRESCQSLVDAMTGEVVVRRCLTRHISDATYNVFTGDSPSPFSPGNPAPSAAQPQFVSRDLVVTNALSVFASPNGWIDDGGNETFGNNVDARLDRNGDGLPDGPRPQGNPARVFNFPLGLAQDPLTYSNAAVTQLFYWVNWHHDRLYSLGFTEEAGNYQTDNFGRGGLGGDAIEAGAQSGADTGDRNNAFFSPSPDGIPAQIAMFVFDGPSPARDGDLDAEVILHEATHGTSERLVGGGVLISALQAAGLSEGWSDFYALSLLSSPSDDPNGNYAVGAYVSFQLFGLDQNYYFGIRHYPCTTDMGKNPFTFKDIDRAQISSHSGVPVSPIYPFNTREADEVHHQGEVWCVVLWEARANLIAKYGGAGNQLMLQLVTDGMKLCPANPNFLQARDAIFLADQVNNGGANFAELWRAFAKRGMGVSATSPDSSTTSGVHEAFDVPGFTIEQVGVIGGNGNGVFDNNECDSLAIVLRNLELTGATNVQVTLSSLTPGVLVIQGDSPYPDISVGDTGTNVVQFKVSTSANFLCGTPVKMALVIKSDQVTRTNQFQLSSGMNGVPVHFDGSAPVAIPDNNSIGTNSPVLVTNIAGLIGKVTVSLFLTHTYDSDLALQLIGPDGTTVTLSAGNGSSGDNYGVNCSPESNRTTFDDDATTAVGQAAPPFVGSFRPDQPLSAFIGKSGTNVNGLWQLRVVDNAFIDVGVLQCWTLNIFPTVCTDGGGHCPGVDLSFGMIDNPDPVYIGGNLTYSISVTNNGPDAATNAVVTQLLPSNVAFVSASSSQGNCSYSGNIITCNIGSMDIGAVATMTATARPKKAGVVSCTASVVSDNSDFNPSNNSATITTLINPPTADLAIGISSAPDPLVVGATLVSTINVTNLGPSTASKSVARITLPSGVSFLSATASQGKVSFANGIVVCNLGNLKNGARASADVRLRPDAEGMISVGAAVVASQFDPLLSNNSATNTVTVAPAHLSQFTRVPNGFQFTLLGFPGAAYAIETASNFPSAFWMPFATNTTTVNGTFRFTDPSPPRSGNRFYRAVRTP